ncbi:AAA family ATPase [Massilia eburnea]|uniref:AAA family ATPase n=1 Tax=Massilia eburnea TaxID=1776165 RepID=UPI003D6AA8A2
MIDEINRGNLSKIFGELLMLIEAEKRDQGWGLRLAYASSTERKFFVPSNVHIIGMMNTADRSVTTIDYALRRRFAFIKVRPGFESVKFGEHLIQKGWQPAFVDAIQVKFAELNESIAADPDLRDGFCVGHSYFCANRPEGWSDQLYYGEIIETEIRPLLEDYWYDKDISEIEAIVEKLSWP